MVALMSIDLTRLRVFRAVLASGTVQAAAKHLWLGGKPMSLGYDEHIGLSVDRHPAISRSWHDRLLRVFGAHIDIGLNRSVHGVLVEIDSQHDLRKLLTHGVGDLWDPRLPH